ncbi:probable protein-S-isoprenylcysteine O-methyltransferase isoform X2 [Dioscorea cayenensis subsp. rotundata]|uniref:Protein-S-isoprenylcysteine O-methyltransferase n=1 Tax=Dioscorea cayennensis subsp. rotundata TaxID=55577 RepID=A0AB40BUP3_DIOCR|nr:probable protein-S-isoprenylcysteine O-methyltransferase isoform X2 [Dioscorea cayenensis subsp. rotundata]XP_039129964.1 probable protein-S-isoprenylcysteine O-methyltransferase isoform X2 [Dioscorea cayenensis subsp. rotundata]
MHIDGVYVEQMGNAERMGSSGDAFGLKKTDFRALMMDLEYVIMIACAFVEYTIELAIFPALKNQWLSKAGLVMVLVGEAIRKISILTAGRAFTHTIRTHHEDHHKLITHGIYKFMRHPGYCGYFITAAGTQVLLCNPICIVPIVVGTWQFFSSRIQYEELFLRQFFGPRYEEYCNRVPSGLPFVK